MADSNRTQGHGVEYTIIGLASLALVWLGLNEVVALIAGAHHPLPNLRSSIAGFVHLLRSGNPVAGWSAPDRADLPSVVVWWVTTTIFVAVSGVITFQAARSIRSGKRGDGWDETRRSPSKREIAQTVGAKAALARARTVRQDVPPTAKPAHVAYELGRDVETGATCWVAADDSVLVLGPPGSGKTSRVIVPYVRSAEGAAVVTSTRDEILRLSAEARGDRPVLVFAPQDRRRGWPANAAPLRWSPVEGCHQPTTAIIRATSLVQAGSGFAAGTTSNADYWAANSVAVVRAYLAAAAMSGGTMREVKEWASAPTSSRPVDILASSTNPSWCHAWGQELRALSQASPQLVGSIWSGVQRSLDCLADPEVLEQVSPTDTSQSLIRDVLAERGTVYLYGSAAAQGSVAPLISALVEAVVEEARQPAGRGQLVVPLHLVLDEAANIAPLPTLPSLMSDGGGSGVQVLVVLQSLAQGRNRWSSEEMDAMWDAASLKLVLPGLAHARDLEELSQLCGEVQVTRTSTARGQSGASTTDTPTTERIWPPARIRSLPEGHALLLHRRLQPVDLAMAGYWERRQ